MPSSLLPTSPPPPDLDLQLCSLQLDHRPPSQPTSPVDSAPSTHPSCGIRPSSLTSLEAVADFALSSAASSHATSGSTLLSRQSSTARSWRYGDADDAASDLPYLDQTFQRLPSSSPPKNDSPLPFVKPRPPLATTSSMASTSSNKLRKPPPAALKLKPARKSSKERLGHGTVREKKAKKRSSFALRGTRSLPGFGCSAARGRREGTMLEKGYGDGWGVEAERGANPSSQPKKPSPTATNSRPPLPKSYCSYARRQRNVAQHASSGESDESFVMVDSTEVRNFSVYRDAASGSSEEDDEAVTPTAKSAPLSDPESTGENQFRRRPALLSYPRLPLNTRSISAPSSPVAPKKPFKLPTLPSPPKNGAAPVHYPTPAGLTDLDFSFNSTSAGHLTFAFPSPPVLSPQLGESWPGPMASTPVEEIASPFAEGLEAFEPEQPAAADDEHAQHVPRGADPTVASTGGMSDLLDHYDRSSSVSGSSDAQSVASSSDLQPLGELYPRQMPIFSAVAAFSSSQPPPLRPPQSPHLAHQPSNAFFPPPLFPQHLNSPSLASAFPSRPLSPLPSPPPPLLDLHAPPPTPAWKQPVAPGSPKPALIQHVKGKALPGGVKGGTRPRWTTVHQQEGNGEGDRRKKGGSA
ncbi:hypothetical protein JCM8097_000818 [Rhodosporidiobolus ruineniae]